MTKRLSRATRTISILLVAAAAAWSLPSPSWAMTAQQAGEVARQKTGGRVLAVKPADGGFQVKVLTPDGKVRYVFVPER